MATVGETRRRVLIVEDDPQLRRTLERALTREGYEVLSAADGIEGVERLESTTGIALIITDLEMPRAGGQHVLAAGLRRHVPVVILTALRAVLGDAFGRAPAPAVATGAAGPQAVIGADAPFQKVLDTISAVAETDATVLITGESGTGKEVAARAIHDASRRAQGPFVAINCGAIPEALLESEMFGHARGAFTGATQSRAGRFQLADRGTLFLDEIGDMPLAFQVKLLRVLQERQYQMLGDGTTRSTDVRVIAATHRDLPKLVADGGFREDLYYRINVIELQLPPLRERRGDIPLLVEHFLHTANARHQRSVSGVDTDALALLQAYSWPGNIRELANLVERMVVLRRVGQLGVSDLPAQLRSAPGERAPSPSSSSTPGATELPAGGLDLRQAVNDLEQSLIEQALARTDGNRNAAAQLLGLKRTTLVEKLKRKP